jgi:hypothetical protein
MWKKIQDLDEILKDFVFESDSFRVFKQTRKVAEFTYVWKALSGEE